MAAPTVYKSTDASAPALTGQKGSLITVLKKCLVEGYSAKTGAGWTIALEDAPNYKIIFRNDSVSGSGRYFRIQDNGRVAYATSGYYGSDRNNLATVVGMNSYTDIDTPVQPYPRVLAGGNLVSDTAYGTTIIKRGDTANPSYNSPWMIIADSRTCYVFTTYTAANTTTLPTGTSATGDQRGLAAFGDLKSYAPNNSILPKSFVMAGGVGAINIVTGGFNEGLPVYCFGYFMEGDYTKLWVDKSLEVSNRGIPAQTTAQYYVRFGGGNMGGGKCFANVSEGQYMHYPSPDRFGLSLNPVVVGEYINDTIRTDQSGFFNYTINATLPGLYLCPHTTASTSSYRVGDELSTVTQDGRSYLLYSLFVKEGDYASADLSQLLALDTGDWWS